jgi:hypothetical protein
MAFVFSRKESETVCVFIDKVLVMLLTFVNIADHSATIIATDFTNGKTTRTVLRRAETAELTHSVTAGFLEKYQMLRGQFSLAAPPEVKFVREELCPDHVYPEHPEKK